MNRLLNTRRLLVALVGLLLGAMTTAGTLRAAERDTGGPGPALAVQEHAGHSGGGHQLEHDQPGDHGGHADHGEHGEHEHEHEHDHDAPKSAKNYEKSLASYRMPNLALTDQFGRDVDVAALLAEDRPALVQFIFTSCSTICPVMGAVFGKAQGGIAAVSPDFRMVSISIDPEYDTPERLLAFAAKQNAGRQWIFLTGRKDEIMKVVRAFDVLYEGDNKMYHQPYTFIRWSSDRPWTRIRGLVGVEELVEEFSAAGR